MIGSWTWTVFVFLFIGQSPATILDSIQEVYDNPEELLRFKAPRPSCVFDADSSNACVTAVVLHTTSNNTHVLFKLIRKAVKNPSGEGYYAAFGMSVDKRMGKDGVLFCTFKPNAKPKGAVEFGLTTPIVTIESKRGFNFPRNLFKGYEVPAGNLVDLEYKIIDGFIVFQFKMLRVLQMNTNIDVVNLKQGLYVQLLSGDLNQEGLPLPHPASRSDPNYPFQTKAKFKLATDYVAPEEGVTRAPVVGETEPPRHRLMKGAYEFDAPNALGSGTEMTLAKSKVLGIIFVIFVGKFNDNLFQI